MRHDTPMPTRARGLRAALPLALLMPVAAVTFARAVAADPLLGIHGELMSVQADQLEVDVADGQAILTGNVTLTKGELKVSCPRLDLRFDTTPHVTWARGSGGVTADVRGVHAEGPEAELDLTHQKLDLRGGVRLSRGQGWLQADRATIDLASAKVTLAQVKGSIPVPPPK